MLAKNGQAGQVSADVERAIEGIRAAIRGQLGEIDAANANAAAMQEVAHRVSDEVRKLAERTRGATHASMRSAELTGFAAGKLEQTVGQFAVGET